MNRIISIIGEFKDSTLEKFIEDYQSIIIGNVDEKIDIDVYMESSGGESFIGDIMLDILDKSPHNITLIAVDEICSAAFNLFFRSKVAKRILPFTIGMAHYGRVEGITVNEKGKSVDDCDIAQIESLKNMRDDTIKFCKSLGMNNSEIRKIRQGKEVYFQHKRLQEFIDNLSKVV